MGQEFFEAGHLGRGADGDTNPGGEVVTTKRANDEAMFLQGEKNSVAITDFDHDVVSGAGDEAEIQFFQERVEAIASLVGEGDGFADVFWIGEGSEGGDLGGGGGIEGLA